MRLVHVYCGLLVWHVIYVIPISLSPFHSFFSNKSVKGKWGSLFEPNSWVETFSSAFSSCHQQRMNADQLAKMELFTELIRFNRWVLSAYLLSRSLEKVLTAVSSLNQYPLSKSIDSGAYGLKNLSTDSPLIPADFAAWLGMRNISLDGLCEPEVTVLTSAVSMSALTANGHQELFCGMNSLKKLLNECVRQDIPEDQRLRSLLMFGPPGCGKSAMLQWLACAGRYPIITVVPSLLLRQYVGQSSAMIKAVFTVAKRLKRSIIWVDEMDALFKDRQFGDHAVYNDIKTEFMQLWDELMTDAERCTSNILVIGASNRPQDIDKAILRRFERSVLVPLPGRLTRQKLFVRYLQLSGQSSNDLIKRKTLPRQSSQFEIKDAAIGSSLGSVAVSGTETVDVPNTLKKSNSKTTVFPIRKSNIHISVDNSDFHCVVNGQSFLATNKQYDPSAAAASKAISDLHWAAFAEMTAGMSCSDIVSICKEAHRIASKSSINASTPSSIAINNSDILEAIRTAAPPSWRYFDSSPFCSDSSSVSDEESD